MLCGLAAIIDLFPTLRTRLLNQLGNMPSGPTTHRTTPGGDADALAKGDTGGQDVESSTAVAKDDADGKTATSKSTDEGEAKNGEVSNKQGLVEDECRCKNKGRQTERCPKNKPRGGKCRGKCKCNGVGKAKAGNTDSDVNDTTPKGIMKMLAGDLCMKLGLVLLAELGVKFSDSPRLKYDLSDMYRMLVAMCGGDKENATAEHQYKASLGSGKVRLPSRSWLLKKLGGVRHDYMLKRSQRMLRRSVVWAKRHGMLRHPVIVAIDEHDIPFHAKVIRMGLASSPAAKRAP